MLSRIGNIPKGHGRLNLSIGNNDHHVGVGRESINVGLESGVSHLHGLKLRLGLATTQLELFDDITNFLKPMGIVLLFHGGRL